MLGFEEKSRMLIYPDKITLEFLSKLKELRKMLNLTLRECLEKTGIRESNLNDYERGNTYPCLKNLIKLANFYNYDISDSINWKFYPGKIRLWDIAQKKEQYALSYGDISEKLGSNKTLLCFTLSGNKIGSLRSLGRIVECLEREKELEKFRNKMLSESIRKDKRRKYVKIDKEVL